MIGYCATYLERNMIVTCGEALIDMIPMHNHAGQQGFEPLVGGAIFNTAIGLGRLGVETAMLSGISMDVFGEQLVEGLQNSHVNTELLIRSTLPTTLAFVRLTNGNASYTFYDENSAGRSVKLADILELPDSVECLYFGGISLISEPGAEAYCQLAEREAKTKVIVLDPNIRTGFIDDEKTYRVRLNRMLAVADIIKVSDEDLDWLVPGGADIAEKVLRLRQPLNKLIVVTRGSESCLAFGPVGALMVEQLVEKVEIVDTVGAGDTFNSGFLFSIVQQGCMHKEVVGSLNVEQVSLALAYGAKVAAVTISRAGANPPWSHEC
jgi:fructokinase